MSASHPESNATSPPFARLPSSAPAPRPKLRSCVVCRSRKVRCDKQSPCSNCRRANIACTFPSTDRPPKWTRRLDRLANNATASSSPAPQDGNKGVDQVMDRLRNLESLVKELRGQLEQAHAIASSVGGGSSGVNSPGRSTEAHDAEHHGHASPAVCRSNLGGLCYRIPPAAAM
jgi:Fungal Zn(2)-Cys(6) binuclear cluster domain